VCLYNEYVPVLFVSCFIGILCIFVLEYFVSRPTVPGSKTSVVSVDLNFFFSPKNYLIIFLILINVRSDVYDFQIFVIITNRIQFDGMPGLSTTLT